MFYKNNIKIRNILSSHKNTYNSLQILFILKNPFPALYYYFKSYCPKLLLNILIKY